MGTINLDPIAGVLTTTTTYTARLVATFPLNGQEGTGESIYLVNEDGDQEFVVQTDHGMLVKRETYADAMRLCLNNTGWGQFEITDVT